MVSSLNCMLDEHKHILYSNCRVEFVLVWRVIIIKYIICNFSGFNKINN